MVHHAALRSDTNVVADLEVLRHANLSANVDVVAQRGATSDARLGRNDAACSELDIVADLNLFIKTPLERDGISVRAQYLL